MRAKKYQGSWREFREAGLARVGTVVEVAEAKKHPKQNPRIIGTFLIGDINGLGGVCDDCMAFGYGDLVVSYTPPAEEKK